MARVAGGERRASAYDVAVHRRVRQTLVTDLQGRDAAVGLYRRLAAGHRPPQLAVGSPDGQPVLLDVVLDCASWSAAEVRYPEFTGFAVGPPLLVVAAMAHTASANRRARQLAEDRSRPQWRPHGRLRFLVTSNATWCATAGGWRCYPHATVTGYEVAAEISTVWMRDTAPLRLAGPGVWCHAVLVAYGLYGSGWWQRASWLEPLRHAAMTPAQSAG